MRGQYTLLNRTKNVSTTRSVCSQKVHSFERSRRNRFSDVIVSDLILMVGEIIDG